MFRDEWDTITEEAARQKDDVVKQQEEAREGDILKPSTPLGLKLPPKFAEWREHQLLSVMRVHGSSKDCFLLDAPTGSGKSVTAAAVQRLSKEKELYLCTTKLLQEQLLADFPYARTLFGRSNYPCAKAPHLFPSVSADSCTMDKLSNCSLSHRCPYMIAKRKALDADLAVLNMSYFLHEANYAGSFCGYNTVVIDEADTVEGQLMNFVELVVTKKQLDRLGIPPPRHKTKFESWVEWAHPTMAAASRELDSLEDAISSKDDWSTINFEDLKRMSQLKRLASKLRFFVKNVDNTWVWYPEEERWSFKPVWVSKYSDNSLWKHGKKFVCMSATILDPVQMDRNVGITLSGKTRDYHQLPSLFPKENRPIYYRPEANMTFKTMNIALPMLVKGVNSLLEEYPKDKVLIHAVSYNVREYLMKNLSARSRLISHNTQDRVEKLEQFKKSSQPLVLISPSMDRGVDLPEDQCRVIIIAKVPYPSLGDPQVKKRVYASKDGNAWYAYHTIASIVQMAGRGVRSKTDWASTYILDEQFGRLFDYYKNMFPGWFLEALVF